MKGKGDKILLLSCYVLLLCVAVMIILPIMNLIAVSISSQGAVVGGKVRFWPKGVQLDAYEYVISSKQFFYSLAVSLFVTLAGSSYLQRAGGLSAFQKKYAGKKSIPFDLYFYHDV